MTDAACRAGNAYPFGGPIRSIKTPASIAIRVYVVRNLAPRKGDNMGV